VSEHTAIFIPTIPFELAFQSGRFGLFGTERPPLAGQKQNGIHLILKKNGSAKLPLFLNKVCNSISYNKKLQKIEEIRLSEAGGEGRNAHFKKE
jgi:hypothetical protein